MADEVDIDMAADDAAASDAVTDDADVADSNSDAAGAGDATAAGSADAGGVGDAGSDSAAADDGDSVDAASVNTDMADDDTGETSDDDGEGSEDEEGEDSVELFGVPEEGYVDFTIPEGLPAPADDYLNDFSEVAKELNLSQAGAQKLVDLHARGQQQAVAAVEKVMTDAHAQWKEELMSDPDLGGSKLAAAVGAARAGFRAVPHGLGEALLSDLKVAKLSSLPSLVRLGHYLSTLHGEGAFERGAGGGSPDPKPRAERWFPNANPG